MRKPFKEKDSMNGACGGRFRASGVAAFVLSLTIGPGCAEPAAQATIIEPSGIAKPAYSRDPNPSAADLIDTWRSSNQYMLKKQVPFERFEIIDRRMTGGRVPRAFLQFVILPARGGDALSWAAARCPGRAAPIEVQVYFEWSKDLGSWTPLRTRGDGDEDLCSGGKLWTPRQIEQLVNPAPLPEPPQISMSDVYTPPQGSVERTAIMDALRPRYETLFGPPIVFRIEKLRVAAGFAFVVVHPQRPNGAPIESTLWKRAMGDQCFQEPTGVAHEYWMREDGAKWTIGVSNAMCADDSISQEGDRIGAPAQLVGRNAWPERDTFPEPK